MYTDWSVWFTVSAVSGVLMCREPLEPDANSNDEEKKICPSATSGSLTTLSESVPFESPAEFA
jgi:hypothetical protein